MQGKRTSLLEGEVMVLKFGPDSNAVCHDVAQRVSCRRRLIG
jgi:hypothetical protein